MSGSYIAIAAGINTLTGGAITDALGLGPSSGSGSVSAAASAEAARLNDPFRDYRSKLGELYSGALTTPDQYDITKMPGFSQYQSGILAPALEASKRSAAASGMMRSGNEQIALEKTAQQGYYGFMTDYLNRLAQGSGATTLPSQGSAVSQGNLAQAGQLNAFGGIAQGLSQIYNASGGGYGSQMQNIYDPTYAFGNNPLGY
jgi:hypothetical protein